MTEVGVINNSGKGKEKKKKDAFVRQWLGQGVLGNNKTDMS